MILKFVSVKNCLILTMINMEVLKIGEKVMVETTMAVAAEEEAAADITKVPNHIMIEMLATGETEAVAAVVVDMVEEMIPVMVGATEEMTIEIEITTKMEAPTGTEEAMMLIKKEETKHSNPVMEEGIQILTKILTLDQRQHTKEAMLL